MTTIIVAAEPFLEGKMKNVGRVGLCAGVPFVLVGINNKDKKTLQVIFPRLKMCGIGVIRGQDLGCANNSGDFDVACPCKKYRVYSISMDSVKWDLNLNESLDLVGQKLPEVALATGNTAQMLWKGYSGPALECIH